MGLFSALFGGTGWDSMPPEFGNDLRRRLGEQRFAEFTSICGKHRLFDQMSQIVKGMGFDSDDGKTTLACFFTSVGNQLGRQGVLQQNPTFWTEAVSVFRVALEIKPDHFAARSSLATTYMAMENTDAAKAEAKRAIADMDEAMRSPSFGTVPSKFEMPPEQTQQFRKMLSAIAQGQMPR